jgi:hypothetical protein
MSTQRGCKRTFAEIFNAARPACATRLFDKARLANALARMTYGKDRMHAYRMKQLLLFRAQHVCPSCFAVFFDRRVNRLLVRLYAGARPGLHWISPMASQQAGA